MFLPVTTLGSCVLRTQCQFSMKFSINVKFHTFFLKVILKGLVLGIVDHSYLK